MCIIHAQVAKFDSVFEQKKIDLFFRTRAVFLDIEILISALIFPWTKYRWSGRHQRMYFLHTNLRWNNQLITASQSDQRVDGAKERAYKMRNLICQSGSEEKCIHAIEQQRH